MTQVNTYLLNIVSFKFDTTPTLLHLAHYIWKHVLILYVGIVTNEYTLNRHYAILYDNIALLYK